MPWIDVKLYDTRVTEESVPKIIDALTEIERELLDIRNRMMVDTGEPGPAPEPERAGRTR